MIRLVANCDMFCGIAIFPMKENFQYDIGSGGARIFALNHYFCSVFFFNPAITARSCAVKLTA